MDAERKTDPFLTFYHRHDGQVASPISETTGRRPVILLKSEQLIGILFIEKDCKVT